MHEISREQLKQRKEVLLTQIDEMPQGIRDVFLAISQGFSQNRQVTEVNVQFVRGNIGQSLEFWGHKYLFTRDDLRKFNAEKYPEACGEMMEIEHGLARIDMQILRDVHPTAHENYKMDRATLAYNSIRDKVLELVDSEKRR